MEKMTRSTNLFYNRKLVIATKHGKEKAVSQMFKEHLGVLPFTPGLIDTDSLGTFTGEIERTLSPLDAARQKCFMAYKLTGCNLTLASEGSFGPHPYYGFIPADEEFLLFKDFKNNIEIIQRHISTKTNYNSINVCNTEELIQFANNSSFPSHGLILRKKSKTEDVLVKDMSTLDDLIGSYHELKLSQYDEVIAETDMRAMNNPTRMSVIAECAEKLVSKIKSLCPNCSFPGFSVTSIEAGLPCELCHLPTRSTLTAISSCVKCLHTVSKKYPNGKTYESPTFCDFCNP